MSLQDAYDQVDRILPQLPGWCSADKGKRLVRLVVESHAKIIVELGVYGGRSLAALAIGCRVNRAGRAEGIDPYDPQASLQGDHARVDSEWWGALDHEGILHAAIHGIEANGLYDYARIIRAKSLDVVDAYLDRYIDVLHQDSNHSEEVSCAEVRAYAPKIISGGFWVFDDIDWPTTLPAQKLLVEFGFERIEEHGTWALYQKGGPR